MFSLSVSFSVNCFVRKLKNAFLISRRPKRHLQLFSSIWPKNPNPKIFSLRSFDDKEVHQIITFQKQEPECLAFLLTKWVMRLSIIKIVVCLFSVELFIDAALIYITFIYTGPAGRAYFLFTPGHVYSFCDSRTRRTDVASLSVLFSRVNVCYWLYFLILFVNEEITEK